MPEEYGNKIPNFWGGVGLKRADHNPSYSGEEKHLLLTATEKATLYIDVYWLFLSVFEKSSEFGVFDVIKTGSGLKFYEKQSEKTWKKRKNPQKFLTIF